MDLHRNEEFFCKILGAYKGPREGVAFQFGQLQPLKTVHKFYLHVEKMPEEALGTNYQIVDAEIKILIEIEYKAKIDHEIWLTCYKVAVNNALDPADGSGLAPT